MTTPAPGTAAPAVEAETTTTPVEAPAAPAAPAVPAPAAPAAPATGAPATTEPAEPRGKAPVFTGEFDPDRAMKAIEALRGEVTAEKQKRVDAETAAKAAADQQQADMVKRLATAFGLPGGEEATPPTVEELAKQLEDQKAETETTRALARQRDVELAVYKAAGASGGDADALLDSRAFLRTIRDLDPTATSFADDVAEAIDKAVKANPKLALKQPEPVAPPARGGADLSGTAGGKRQYTAAEVKAMSPDQIVKAREAGLLKDYMSGPG